MLAAIKAGLLEIWLGVRRRIVRLTERRRVRWGGAEPVGVVGFHSRVLGIGETARLFVAALRGQDRDAVAIDLGEGFRPQAPAARPAWLLSHLNAPELDYMMLRRAPGWMRRAPHVGYWVWELERLPRRWARAGDLVDAVWTPSAFSAGALEAGLKGAAPVTVLPPPIFAAPVEAVDLSDLGVPEGAISVLAVCDLRSTAARKNPHGAVQAFLEARARTPDVDAMLILKIVGAQAEPDAFDPLKRLLDGRRDVRLLTDSLTDARMVGLIRACDIAVSLHRSEGFGLLAAHAAYAGRAVLATAWSAPLEFLCEEGAALTPFKTIPVSDPQGLYPAAGRWAEPDAEAAATQLAGLLSEPDRRRRLGQAAAAHAEARLGPAAWARGYVTALEALERSVRA